MLDDTLKAQLGAYLEKLTRPLEIVASVDDGANSKEMLEMLSDIEALSGKITLKKMTDDNERKPSFALNSPGQDIHLRFSAIPLGHEFSSLVLALLQVGGHPPRLEAEQIEQIKSLKGEFNFVVYMSLSCQNCPEVVQSLNTMAVLNPAIRVETIDGALFQDEVERLQILSVPTIFLNGQEFAQGRMGIDEFMAKLDDGAVAREAEKLSAKEPFDVLVVGGGPAGSTAAVYAARKGLRTGVVAQRYGGQVLDTLSIENFISVKETQGPELAAAMEEHVRSYGVDIMNLQTATQLSKTESGFTVKFDSGAQLHSKTVVIATGARWRDMGVPGESEYRTKGVTYCPHCDGPLFKGKNVAVIGGGNSGIEAAIDLAGVVKHVTVLEFANVLRADEVLQRKARSMPNIDIIMSAKTIEVVGDGQKVAGLRYEDMAHGCEEKFLDVEGVFVQIGLLPNTGWLKDTLELNRGEIVVGAHGETSMPGVFAAGDCTNSAYKQIVISVGAGATAALGAFDYMIRN
ncbi:MAG: alkyl hydroperoxide reductase subunit F [Saezia sp.]